MEARSTTKGAICGFDMTFRIHTVSSITRTKPRIEKLEQIYSAVQSGQLPPALAVLRDSVQVIKSAGDRIDYEADLAKALADAGLVNECLPEVLSTKQDFFKKAAPFITKEIVVATNNSSLLPSQMTPDVSYPENFLAMHFANMIWQENLCEIMPSMLTAPGTTEKAKDYALKMGMCPIVMNKEHAGYLLNSLLIPFPNVAQTLVAEGIADPQAIDLAWKTGTGAPYGPFEMLNIIGLPTALHIVQEDPRSRELGTVQKIGRASCRERVWLLV